MKIQELISNCAQAFHQQFGQQLTPGHKRALDAMLACRSACGECIVSCQNCNTYSHLPLSCGHRACPQCQVNLGENWFNRQQQKLLPAPYFMVTFTLPAELRQLVWRQQHIIYDLLFAAASTALKTIGKNNHGINIGMTGVLHTHTRALDFHPHLHFIVPGGGLDIHAKTPHWKKLKGDYLVNEIALGKVFRGLFLQLLDDNAIEAPRHLPKQWVANIKMVGRGEKALRYLSRYLYRGVISQNNIMPIGPNQIAYQYQDSKTKKRCTKIQDAPSFLWKLMQHVLPRGFRRVRDYGFLHANAKKQLLQAQHLLRVKITKPKPQKKPICCRVCKHAVEVVLVLAQKIPILFRANAPLPAHLTPAMPPG
jgi:hypothetical protein